MLFDKGARAPPPPPSRVQELIDYLNTYGPRMTQESRDKLVQQIMTIARTPGLEARVSRTYAHQVKPLAARVQGAIDKVCGQLPIRLCSRISSIRFGPDGVIDPTFEVEYMGGKVIQFENVDEFPTEADIARIALECP